MILFICLAAAASALTFCVHTFVGRSRVAGPLLADQSLPFSAKWLGYYCWHITTVMLAFFIGAFVWLAIHPDIPSLVFLGGLSSALSALSIAVTRMAGISPWRFPSTSLFATIAVLSVVAVQLR